ncbi:MAG: serine hydrolase domain-containing protein, partial [Bacteroidota bacterium]
KNAKGTAELAHNVPIQPNTVFQVAELGNQFIAFGALLLAEKGKMDLEASVRKYLPELPDYAQTITVNRLMSHTNGLSSHVDLLLASGWAMSDWKTRPQVLKVLGSQNKLRFAPGERMDHSLTGFVLLADIIERISGLTFSDYMGQQVFQPLGMQHTAFVDQLSKIMPQAAPTYYQLNGEWRESTFGYFRLDATNLQTSIEDLALWIKNRQQAQLGSPKTHEYMSTQVSLTNGDKADASMGQFVLDFKSRKGLYQTGMAYGRIGCLLHFPEANFGVVALSNQDTYNTQRLALQASEVCLPGFFKEPETEEETVPRQVKGFITLDQKALKKYEGHYWNDQDLYARSIYLKADTLRYDRGEGNESKLVPVSENSFYMLDQPEDVYISFEQEDGKEKMIFSILDFQYASTKFTPAEYNKKSFEAFEGYYFSKELGAVYQIIYKDGKLVANHAR